MGVSMGIYNRLIVPRLIELAMRNDQLTGYRKQVIQQARGAVLEIGIGSGVNLPLYSPAVSSLVAIDPSSELLKRAKERAANAVAPVWFVRATAEHLPFADAVFDTIVMTWTLCSIPHPIVALREMRRVLNPQGRLVFVEHGLSPEPGIAWWQRCLTPFWCRMSGGCHLDREMDDLIRSVGFALGTLETGYMKGPKPWTYMYQGSAMTQ